MNRRDQQLLDKQLWSVSPYPPGNGGILGLVAVFCAGLAIGAVLFTQSTKQPHFAWRAATAVSSPSGVPTASLQ